MATKRDYERAAKAVRETIESIEAKTLGFDGPTPESVRLQNAAAVYGAETVAIRMALLFSEENERFDVTKFYEAAIPGFARMAAK